MSCSPAAAASSSGCRSCAAPRRCATSAKALATRLRPRPIPARAHRHTPQPLRASPSGDAARRAAAVAGVPRRQCRRRRRRTGRCRRVGRRDRREHQLEDGDPGPRHLQPDRLGRPRDRRHRGERRRHVVPHRPLRRRQAGRRPADAHAISVYALDRATGKVVWQRDAFSGTPLTKRHTKSSQANATPVDRRPAHRRGLRLDWPDGLLRHGRHAAVEERHRRARQRLVPRSRAISGAIRARRSSTSRR